MPCGIGLLTRIKSLARSLSELHFLHIILTNKPQLKFPLLKWQSDAYRKASRPFRVSDRLRLRRLAQGSIAQRAARRSPHFTKEGVGSDEVGSTGWSLRHERVSGAGPIFLGRAPCL